VDDVVPFTHMLVSLGRECEPLQPVLSLLRRPLSFVYVHCEAPLLETVDLLLLARAEIVIEGYFRLRELERERPFGEYAGYMGTVGVNSASPSE